MSYTQPIKVHQQPVMPPAAAKPHTALSPQQTRVLAQLETGLSYKQTAASLGISVNTVKFHLRKILRKTGSMSAKEAIFKLRYRSHGSK